MLVRLTDRLRIVMASANREARRLNHDAISPAHILLGLIEDSGGTAAQAFGALELKPNELQPKVEALADGTFIGSAARAASKELLYDSQAQADSLNHEYIGTGHLLLALLNKEGPLVTDAIEGFGANAGQLRETTLSVLASNDPLEP